MAHSGGQNGLSSWLPLLGVAVLAASYLLALLRQRGRWRVTRAAAFLSGAALLALALWPGVARWAHHDLRGHMLQHLLIGMFAPLGLVLGAPVTLLLRSLPASSARTVTRVLRTRPVRVLSHPVAALVLNIGGMYLLYLTPLYALTASHPWLHTWLHLHFLAAGYLFTWAILAGPDPAPHTPGIGFRLGVLFVAMGSHAILGKLMYGHLWPRGTPHHAEEIQAAAQWMYYGGDLAEVLLAIALFAFWYRARPGSRRYRMRARVERDCLLASPSS